VNRSAKRILVANSCLVDLRQGGVGTPLYFLNGRFSWPAVCFEPASNTKLLGLLMVANRFNKLKEGWVVRAGTTARTRRAQKAWSANPSGHQRHRGDAKEKKCSYAQYVVEGTERLRHLASSCKRDRCGNKSRYIHKSGRRTGFRLEQIRALGLTQDGPCLNR
jgi:hypothetical protein